MPSDVVVLIVAGALALVALLAAGVTVRAARQVARDRRALTALTERAEAQQHAAAIASERSARRAEALVPVPYEPREGAVVLRSEIDVPLDEPAAVSRVVDGKVFVAPTQHDVVATALSRPSTRVAVLVHGLAHALRPESRDRISALMRREFTRRRRERQRAGRRAARLHTPSAQPGTAWVSGSGGQTSEGEPG